MHYKKDEGSLAEQMLAAFVNILTEAYTCKELRYQAESLLARLEALGGPRAEIRSEAERPRDSWRVANLESRMATVRYVISLLESRREAANEVAAGI